MSPTMPSAGSKLLITGGTGFIGSRLALAARGQGREVVVTGQANTDAERQRLRDLEANGISVALGPLQDPALARTLVENCDAVIHLAAAQHEANVPDEHFESVNVGGTRTLLAASREAGVRRFVYGSTIGVYGAALDGRLDEGSATHPDNVYGRTKLAAEQVVREGGNGIETCIVRISETYGPGDFRLLKLFRAVAKGAFVMIGDGANERQVIHVSDLAQGLLQAVECPRAAGQTFVLAGAEVMTTRDMVSHIAQALGKPTPRLRVPLWPFMAAAVVFEKTMRPLGMQPPLHRRRLDFFRKSFVFSTEKAREFLGFEPSTRFTEGAAETAAWYRSRGYLS